VSAFDLLPTEAKCPACGAHFDRLAVREVLVAACPGCGGLWLDSAACYALTDGSLPDPCEAFIRDVTENAVGRTASAGYRAAPTLERVCPVCREPLTQRSVERPRVVVDVCAHGTFFDHGELAGVMDRQAERRARTAREVAAFRADAEVTVTARIAKAIGVLFTDVGRPPKR